MDEAQRKEREVLVGEFHRRLAQLDAPIDPALAPELYVEQLHCDADHDPIRELSQAILYGSGSEIYYFTGQRGTGKSTELHRLKQRLQDDGALAFYADMLDYVPETEPLLIGDFLVALVGAWSDVLAARTELRNLKEPNFWERFTRFLGSNVEFEGLGIAGGVMGTNFDLKLALRHNPSFKKKLQDAAAERLEDVRREAHAFTRESVAALHALTGDHRQVVFIVDSLERLRGVTPEGIRSMFDHVVTLFDARRDDLRLPGMSVVYSVPPYLEMLTNVQGSGQLFSLSSVSVFERPDGLQGMVPLRPAARGLSKLREMLQRRYPHWSQVLDPAAVDRLALQSGGDLRQFMIRFVQRCLRKALSRLDALPLQADHPIVVETIEEARAEYQRFVSDDDLPLLASVHEKQDIQLSSVDEELPHMARLFDNRAVLSYRNGRQWFDVHPMLVHRVEAHVRRSVGDARNGD